MKKKLVKKNYSKGPASRVPSIIEQTDWDTGFFNFGRALEGPRPRRFFNPSVLRHGNADWLFARLAEDVPEHRFGQNSIWAFKLGDNHTPLFGKKIDFSGEYADQHFEDPRVTRFRTGAAISYTTFLIVPTHEEEGTTAWYGAHQAIAFLDDHLNVGHVMDPVYGGNGGSVMMNDVGEKGQKINQKNWLWFEHDGAPHTVYMTDPHEVVKWGSDWGPKVVYRQSSLRGVWEGLGQVRGGTPPILVGDEYWSFFHSSTQWEEWNRVHKEDAKRRYHMGAYAFEAKPPFRIKRITPLPILTGSMRDPWMAGLPLVVFPCGALFRNNSWFVTLGVNDCASAWIEIPHKDLEKITLPYHGSSKNKKTGKTSKPASHNRNRPDSRSMENGPVLRTGGSPNLIKSSVSGDAGNRGGLRAGKGRGRASRTVAR